jgi:TetR/AcrR family transcriptional regulator, copper-responsive repressor
MPGKRGRPIEYNAGEALSQARDLFWANGFAATSLDALSAATGMNRPSLFGAFGDKETLYLATLRRYRDESVAAMRETLTGQRPLRVELAEMLARATDAYLDTARGCLLIGTASVEATQRPAVREMLAASLQAFNAVVEQRLRKAAADGEIGHSVDPADLAMIVSTVMHSLAVRARAGDSRAALDRLSAAALDLICTRSPKRQPKAGR